MKGGLNYWAWSYLRDLSRRARSRRALRDKTTHIVFLMCDHYEPRHKAENPGQEVERVSRWERDYLAFFKECINKYGHGPRHTWFYPPHHGIEHLAALNRLVLAGCGEIELHLHHDNDNDASFRRLMTGVIADYQRRGILLTSGEKPHTAFSFIHGDWALDNSHPRGRYCGVDNEITLLQEFGCWGDFTMPSSNECQTKKINSIYYAVDDPLAPKSHDTGVDLKVGKKAPENSFFMMQGPLGINLRAPRYPRIENASVTTGNWGRPDRIQAWLNSHIHVQDRPEWVFVKLHAHGAVEKDFDALFGQRARAMHKMLNEVYNDGKRYRLHYATAREAYNICMAAEAGKDGDPSQFRDFRLAPYAHNFYHCSLPHQLHGVDKGYLNISGIGITAQAEKTNVVLAAGRLAGVNGRFSGVVWQDAGGRLELTGVEEGDLEITMRQARIKVTRGAQLIREQDIEGGCLRYVLGPCSASLEIEIA